MMRIRQLWAISLVLVGVLLFVFIRNGRIHNSVIMRSAKDDTELVNDNSLSPKQSNSDELGTDSKSRCHPRMESSEWSPPEIPHILQNVSQDSTNLAEYICKEWLMGPSLKGLNLRNNSQTYYSQREQDEFVDDLLGARRNGFYVECGAASGEQMSNTLFFERSRDWSGLLIEANPKMFKTVLDKQRNAFTINACLSPTKSPMQVNFKVADVIGGIADLMDKTHVSRIEHQQGDVQQVQVQCFPIYSILKAMNVTYVDYFSLDIEGAELQVLYTLPLKEITVEVFSIEYAVDNDPKGTTEKLAAIKEYLVEGHGYKIVRIGVGEDVILQKTH